MGVAMLVLFVSLVSYVAMLAISEYFCLFSATSSTGISFRLDPWRSNLIAQYATVVDLLLGLTAKTLRIICEAYERINVCDHHHYESVDTLILGHVHLLSFCIVYAFRLLRSNLPIHVLMRVLLLPS